MSQSVVIAKPADVDLQKDPIRPHWIIEGNPQARSRKLAMSADGTSWIAAWSCTAGRFNWHYSVDETVHILSGEVFITDAKDRKRRLGPGDMAFFPAGTHSIWHVPNEVRKLAVCRHTMPGSFGKCVMLWNKVAHRFFGAGSKRRASIGAMG
jgi:uncharacterized cupin superfamily protein